MMLVLAENGGCTRAGIAVLSIVRSDHSRQSHRTIFLGEEVTGPQLAAHPRSRSKVARRFHRQSLSETRAQERSGQRAISGWMTQL